MSQGVKNCICGLTNPRRLSSFPLEIVVITLIGQAHQLFTCPNISLIQTNLLLATGVRINEDLLYWIESLIALLKQFLFDHLVQHWLLAFVPWSGLGLRYLEAFFGLLITVMCVMFGWMVSARGEKSKLQRSMWPSLAPSLFFPLHFFPFSCSMHLLILIW